jgi:colicin import membrane protein
MMVKCVLAFCLAFAMTACALTPAATPALPPAPAPPSVVVATPPRATTDELLASYVDQVRRRIRSNMVYKEKRTKGNPEALFEIQLKPDMNLASVKQIGKSGNPAFDKAVKRAIEKAGAYPPLPDGLAFSLFATHKIKYRLNDLL